MKIRLLCTERDRENLRPIIDALGKKGVTVSDKAAVTLCALSEGFYADKSCVEALLTALGKGAESVLPLQLDGAPIPDTLKNALYARNILSAEGRAPALLAERIVDALPRKKSRLPLFLTLAGAAALALIGLLVWNAGKKPAETVVPVMADPAALASVPAGISPEELSEVRCVVIIGEHFRYFTEEEHDPRDDGEPGWPDMLYTLGDFMSPPEAEGTGEFHWYWKEDGSAVTHTAYDLRFLSLMPNLEELHLADITVTEAPDLSGLDSLKTVWAFECDTEDLSWLAESHAETLSLRTRADYAVLGRSESLTHFLLDIYGDAPTDLSAFSPANLVSFDLVCWNVDSLDLSGLRNCAALREFRLANAPIRDLSFLSGNPKLTNVYLVNLPELRDISALGEARALRSFGVWSCGALEDFSALSGCAALERFDYGRGRGRATLRSASFLRGLRELQDIFLEDVALDDLDFLRGLDPQDGLWLRLSGRIGDYAGLAAIRSFAELELRHDSTDFSEIAPYLQNASIQTLRLTDFSRLDLADVPPVTGAVFFQSCGLRDLSSMRADWRAIRLVLENCRELRSLDGLQNQSRIGALELISCPRLTDWSALDGMHLSSLQISGCYTLPDFGRVGVTSLRLENIADVEDLHFLDALDESRSYTLALVGLSDVQSLAPLSRLHGARLTVSPQLAEQAEDLVRAGNFREYDVEYPRGGWEMDESFLTLTSWEEMETLPAALLRRVERLTLAGEELVDPDRFEVWADHGQRDAQGRPVFFLHDRESDAETALTPGTLPDLSAFSALTGLRELELFVLPLSSLEGVQSFTELELLRVRGCYELRDASPAFAVENLLALDLGETAVDSLQGVQNLWRLRELDVAYTAVTDLTPLLELENLERVLLSGDMKAAMESLQGREVSFEIEIR